MIGSCGTRRPHSDLQSVAAWAVSVLLSLGQGRVHLKNWYPAPLILAAPWTTTTDLETIDEPCHPGLIRLCKYLQPRKVST